MQKLPRLRPGREWHALCATAYQGNPVAGFAQEREMLQRPPVYTGVGSTSEHNKTFFTVAPRWVANTQDHPPQCTEKMGGVTPPIFQFDFHVF